MNAIALQSKGSDYSCWMLEKFYRRQTGGEMVGHQRSCRKCFTWLYENDRPRFNLLLSKATNAKVFAYNQILDFAYSKDYPVSIKNNENSQWLKTILRCCSPYKIPEQAAELPTCSGVYILVASLAENNRVTYVGKTNNSIRARWAGHHRLYAVERLLEDGVELNMYCLILPSGDIESIETDLIKELQPTFNVRKYYQTEDRTPTE